MARRRWEPSRSDKPTGYRDMSSGTHVISAAATPPVSKIIADRQGTHGVFRENTKFIQAVKELMRQQPNWGKMYAYEMEALDMFAHKMGRILHGDPHYEDHWEDVAGYAQRVVKTLKGDLTP